MSKRHEKITIRDLTEGYTGKKGCINNDATAWSGKLVIRPSYQRDYFLKPDPQKQLMYSLLDDISVNQLTFEDRGSFLYWMMDGQQRLATICEFVLGRFSIMYPETNGHRQNFQGLSDDVQKKFLDTEIDVVIYSGLSQDRILKIIQRINTRGTEHNDQEKRNMAYPGPWLEDAKGKFSAPNCPASGLGEGYIKGTLNRQEILKLALEWITDGTKEGIEEYMKDHRDDLDASELYDHYEKIMNWVQGYFINANKHTKCINWGDLYKRFKDHSFNESIITKSVSNLLQDSSIGNRPGIYEYVLSKNEQCLSLRQFDEAQKRKRYAKQKGMCKICGKPFKFEEMHGDHILAWILGGLTEYANLQMLCAHCNLKKYNKVI